MLIHLFDHPFEAAPPKVIEADHIGTWLLEYYGDAPSVRVQVFEGNPSGETEITGNVERLVASDASIYTVLESPAGVDPISWAYFAAAAIIAIVAAVALAPKPAMPSNVNRTQSSPNNSLSDRSNKLRLLERVEDIYGQVRAIPSLMMPTYNKYHDNRQYEYGYYCITRGYADISDVRDAETLVSDIDGASAAVYEPFTSPNGGGAPQMLIGDPIADPVVQVRRAEEVDGITLKAPNQVQIPAGEFYDFYPDPDGDYIIQRNPNPNFDTIADPGESITISATPPTSSLSGSAQVVAGNVVYMTGIEGIAIPGWSMSFTGFANAGNNSSRVIMSVNPGVITLGGSAMTPEPSIAVTATATGQNISGTYTVKAVSDATVRVTTNTWITSYINKIATITLSGASEWSGWTTVPDAERTQVWSNIVAPQGMYKDSGTGPQTVSVGFEMQVERLDPALNPTGLVETFSGTIGGSSSDERAITFERTTSWVGPIRVRMRRSTNYDFAFSGTLIDEIKWRDLYSVTPVAREHFGNKTTIHTVTKATERAISLRNRQINCLAYRKLPVYDGTSFSGEFNSGGRLISGTIYPTSQITDIIAAVSLDNKIGQRSLADIDIDQIYETNLQVNQLHPEAGQFNYTFDSDTTSYEETVTTIANAAFCVAYRQNGTIRLAFDQLQPQAAALFTHRNKKPRSDAITRRFATESDYDSVEFIYQDPVTETSETINLPLDGSGFRPKKYEIAGIRSFAQAWLRANREYYKLIGQRLTLKMETTGEGRALLPNAKIAVADNTRYATYDGEVVGQFGMELVLSRDVVFADGEPHSIVLIRRDGSLESIPVTPGSDVNRVLLSYLPAEAVVTQYGPDGIRTIFSFGSDATNAGTLQWLVQEIDQRDRQYVGVTAINYSADYYQADNQQIPPRESIIN